MRDTDLPALRALRLFQGMDDDQFTVLMQGAFLQPFPAHVDLISEGDPADFLHLVIEGCIELYAQSNGRQNTMAMLRPETSFILAAVVTDGPYLMSARTCNRSRVLLVPAASVRDALKNDSALFLIVGQ